MDTYPTILEFTTDAVDAIKLFVSELIVDINVFVRAVPVEVNEEIINNEELIYNWYEYVETAACVLGITVLIKVDAYIVLA